MPIKEFGPDWYDESYFADPEGKEFRRPNGTTQRWGYRNPEGEFFGAADIARAWKEMFNPRTALDVGCGRGTFVAYMRDAGIEAYGFDFSTWAIRHPYPRCKPEWLMVHDATKPWPYPPRRFDLVVALDFYEHIYEEDLDRVIREMYRVAGKWIFLQIAVVGGGSGPGIHPAGYILKRGEAVPVELEANAVAGHVTVCSKEWWEERLEDENWVQRRDMAEWFTGLVPSEIISNWLKNAILVYERVG
jgi:SAM-dependent methyltransferase